MSVGTSSAILLIVIVSAFAGFYWGTYLTKILYSNNFKHFSDELSQQYIKCIKSVENKYDIKIDWNEFKP